MSRTYINVDLRRLVVERAGNICEYCLISAVDRSSGCQVDHIISVKHGGASTDDNLCYACVFCNLQKGTDLGSINWRNGELVRFFNPRRDLWGDHFRLDEAVIQPLTDIGEVTTRILDFNNDERIIERLLLIEVGKYPPTSAKGRISK
ncbi:HNH endonuclease [Anabaena cylindrica FACHB-243]|uniref:HNH endonuclease n=1 Tax=Anabaena cylindrica (strain ATCC 27899 / PCC 7122) TaxID=272123 RepID=K9Z948_ANACC|nr:MULTISPECIES: HNH endonuclease signature motif containing protein [Anabaena]AFZ55703.1 HNH endonuclease [Anabaena cylindrica PCC 7122]MBD2420292.1 HNH endonuclease [Anabaena cylindrica FACHB-243]MBY5282094.1 HNH endonuclease [Anabaena sp. CCAP 1446/1C]MBY5309609.1 HNH endonuclease [Anabaena sp. CCAP 1446/1C]MCM2406053.1 HNH endonuclease [Anabaena sp. CCAP 1446/1C]